MIYNLVQYLRDQFPAEVIYPVEMYKTSTQQSIPDRIIILRDSGGIEQPWTRYSSPTIQIYSRDDNPPASRKLAYDIYDHFQEHQFGLILPAITVGVTTYPAVQIAQISAIQQPYKLNTDENGRTEYTTNYKIIFERGG